MSIGRRLSWRSRCASSTTWRRCRTGPVRGWPGIRTPSNAIASHEASMSDPVPAITEAAATGETAAIFADIRQVLGVDVVNLIWRHLATIDDALPWTWGTLRQFYVDGTMRREAAALHGELALPPMQVIPAEGFTALGLRPDD